MRRFAAVPIIATVTEVLLVVIWAFRTRGAYAACTVLNFSLCSNQVAAKRPVHVAVLVI